MTEDRLFDQRQGAVRKFERFFLGPIDLSKKIFVSLASLGRFAM